VTRVLIIDDEESICWGLAKLCAQMSLESVSVSSAEKGLDLCATSQFDLVILDIRLPGMDGLTAMKHFQQRLGKIPIIAITAFGDLQTAIEAMQRGAFEYIVKPFELETVRHTIQQAIATAQILNGLSRTSAEHGGTAGRKTGDDSVLIGSSPVMQSIYRQIALATTTDSPVLITGESGTGKELAARSIHRFGSRAAKPFVAVNIAALSPTLAESELFGHVKGAYTGADSDRTGLIRLAHGGTLFLDEVADIPLEVQVKLLRVLDLGEVTPVGSNTPLKTDFRLISATHQDLLAQVNLGEFRHDLFYRLRTLEVQLPPLRQRTEDIPELVNYFVNTASAPAPISIDESVIGALTARSWPGNVRELQSVIDRAVTMARGGVLTANHLEDPKQHVEKPGAENLDQEIQRLVAEWTRRNWSRQPADSLYNLLLTVVDPAILQQAFELSEHQYSAAARRLGIHRTTLKKKLDEIIR
jgi:two-component system nitrogen regulation response regulator GlnG